MPDYRYEPEDIFDRQEAAERRARIEAAERKNAEVAAEDARLAAERKESARQLSMRANASVLITEYVKAGVEPLAVNGDGVPTVSLGFLLYQGWEVREISGVKKLIAPIPEPVRPRKTRADYDQSS